MRLVMQSIATRLLVYSYPATILATIKLALFLATITLWHRQKPQISFC